MRRKFAIRLAAGNTPDILRRGAAWFSAIGRPNNVGTKLFCVSGHVDRPCNVEEAMGIPFRELIERHCGGIRGGWDNLKAVIPGGSSVRMVPAEQIIDTPIDFDSLSKLRSGLGTAAVIVMDKSTDLISNTLCRLRSTTSFSRLSSTARSTARRCAARSRCTPRAARSPVLDTAAFDAPVDEAGRRAARRVGREPRPTLVVVGAEEARGRRCRSATSPASPC